MEIAMLVLVSIGILAVFLLSILFIYLIMMMRRSNIILKKVDYLVEDITYKAESLSVSVDAITRVSNYLLMFDATSKKHIGSLVKLISENREFFYSFASKVKNEIEKKEKDLISKKNKPKKQTSKKPKTTVKKEINNKQKSISDEKPKVEAKTKKKE